ncbi:hypothetical protein [Streptomyces sp. NPDC001139]
MKKWISLSSTAARRVGHYRGHPEHPSHAHPDIAAQLTAARARHDARLLAYA